MKSYGKFINNGSLKLRIMGEIIEKCSNNDWTETQCHKHENDMIDLLKVACKS